METRAFFILGLAALLSLIATAAFALDNNFDSCVNSLYTTGGVSQAQARRVCLPGISPEILNCQNKRFLVDFYEPLEALKSCHENLEMTHFQDYPVYRGSYEDVPMASTKKIVCSITVNSTEERTSFRNQLNPNEYSWVELLPFNKPEATNRFIPRDNSWVKKACEEKIRCDILVISGHFASTFIGSQGFEVKLEDLTKISCDQGCKDLFGSVKQVYLFGCNTLAEKRIDQRSVEQYREILITDGIAPHQAQRITARRYTSYGESIQDEVRKAFPSAASIFGFIGPGPTGALVKAPLMSYLKNSFQEAPSGYTEAEIFKKTLGGFGMHQTTGLPQDQFTCQFPKSSIRSNDLMSVQGLSNYLKTYSHDLPVAAIDLLDEARQRNILTDDQYQVFVQRVLSEFEKKSVIEKRHLLCPLILSGHSELVPADLFCLKDPSWI